MSASKIQETFDLARSRHQAGQLSEAEALYRQVLAREPNHAPTFHMLGMLAVQVGRADMAIGLFRTAIARTPNPPAPIASWETFSLQPADGLMQQPPIEAPSKSSPTIPKQ